MKDLLGVEIGNGLRIQGAVRRSAKINNKLVVLPQTIYFEWAGRHIRRSDRRRRLSRRDNAGESYLIGFIVGDGDRDAG